MAGSQLLLTTLISIYYLSIVWHLELFPKCIERNYILGFQDQEMLKHMTSNNRKHLRVGFSMNFHRTNKLLWMADITIRD